MDSRQIITHLGCVALGLAAGIYLSSGSSPNMEVTEPQSTAVTAVPGPDNSNPGNPIANSTTATTNNEPVDPVLIKLRDDYAVQIQQGESRQALLILQDMEKKFPNSQIYAESNSDYQVFIKDWQNAAIAAKNCTAKFPKSRPCFRNLATAEMLDGGSTEEQSAAVEACLALEPNDPQCRNMKGQVQMNSGDFQSAIAVYEKLIQDNGSFGMRFNDDHLEYHLGLALEGAGRQEEAIEHLENACRRNNNAACKKIEEISGGGYD